jgi:hypothetical protein
MPEININFINNKEYENKQIFLQESRERLGYHETTS